MSRSEYERPDAATLRMVAWLARSRAALGQKVPGGSEQAHDSSNALQLFARDLEAIASGMEQSGELIWLGQRGG
jgi:hypothetical protein